MKKKYTTIRQLKQRLANFAKTYREGFIDSETKDYETAHTPEQLLTEKCAIINRVLFGEDEADWSNPKYLVSYLEGFLDSPSEMTVDAAQQLINVINYLSGVDKNRPYSLAVFEPATELSQNIYTEQKEFKSKIALNRSFLQAATAGNVDAVRHLLNLGANIDALNKDKRTALMMAATKGNLRVVQFLLNRGAKVRLGDNNGWTAFFCAVMSGYKDVAKLLMKNGDSPNGRLVAKKNDKKNPAVSKLAGGGYAISSLDDFFRNKKPRGEKYINVAIELGNLDAVKMLIELGAYPYRREGDTAAEEPLTVAVEIGHDDIAKYLLDILKHTERDYNLIMHDTPYMDATSTGNAKLVEFLIGNGDPTEIDNMFAHSYNNINIMNLLLDAGADVNAYNNIGRAAIHGAMVIRGEKFRETVKFLLDNGADINLPASDGTTPLMFACSWGNPEDVEFLLNHGADVNMADKSGYTALDDALDKKYPSQKMIDILKAHGAKRGR